MHYKSIFISDIHLGSRYSNAEMAHKFLRENTCDKLVLVGDIIDAWALRRKWFFPQSHINVIQEILKHSKQGTEVIYVIGNHDEFLRGWLNLGVNFGNISFTNEYTHVDTKGCEWLIVHGDLFDSIMQYHWLTWIGDHIYTLLNASNFLLNKLRTKFGFGYWSLSQWAKNKTKKALNFVYRFEDHLALYAKNKNFAGVICGHIHFSSVKKLFDIMYVNTGDFCETCSAVVEREDGIFELQILKDAVFIVKSTFDVVAVQ